MLADHARATAFLLADGVFPSNEGRGYVLRRILRRAVRHAWLLGRRQPTLVEVVEAVVDRMSGAFPELASRREYLVRNTRAEEERFLATIEAGIRLFDQLAPEGGSGTLAGADVFKLYDTFGFPVDLTELMARERGYEVELEGFERALDAQRRRSREDRAAAGIGVEADAFAMGWEEVPGAEGAEQDFAAYRATSLETDVLAFRRMEDGRVALQLRENPFYAESGGQVSDRGHVRGEGWTLAVEEARRVAGRVAVVGAVEGDFAPGRVSAEVEEPPRRDTERNHTATHLLHAALRRVLGDHVHQQGSVVEPGRLRFDFAHTGPLTPEQVAEVEGLVNEAIWANQEVCATQMGYQEAIGRGAMALFSDKYGDVVRVVEIPGVSMELCGGTHVRTTGQIGLFRVVSESGVAAGVRRIEAVTGREAFERVRRDERTLREAAALLKTREENLLARVQQVLEQQRELQRQLERARSVGERGRGGAAPGNGADDGRGARGGGHGGGGGRGGAARPGRPAARAAGERDRGARREPGGPRLPPGGGHGRRDRARGPRGRGAPRGGHGGRRAGRGEGPHGAGRAPRRLSRGGGAGPGGGDGPSAPGRRARVTPAERWVRGRLADAPPRLLDAMAGALPAEAPSVPDALAEGALLLLDRVASGSGGREDALPLLAADALLTHAFQAQAEEDPEGVPALAGRWGGAGRLGELAARFAAGSSRVLPALLLAVLALGGCRGGEPRGSFSATLAGPIEGKVAGEAVFCRRADGAFLLVLHDPQTSAGFLLGRRSGAPAPGPYAVVDSTDTVEDRFWFATRLDSLPGASEYRYHTDEGSLRVVSADSAWVKGRFQVELVAVDAKLDVNSKTGEIRRLPNESETVSGTFAAARAASCDLP